MFALTLYHPWPFTICELGKDIENRKWAPSPKRLKPGDLFALHGGVPETLGIRYERECTAVREICKGAGSPFPLPNGLICFPDPSVYAGIFAMATFGGIVTQSDSRWFFGPKGWILGEVLVLDESLPCVGRQGLWTVPRSVESSLRGMIVAEQYHLASSSSSPFLART